MRPKVLVAPLDWGLGHATRCIPIIKELIELNCEVVIAADYHIYFLLKNEFPSTVFLRLRGYEMEYSRNKNWLYLKLLRQAPGLLWNIQMEHKWLDKVIEQYNIDAVVSDNRFGMHSKKVPCIYITHQLLIKTGNSFIEKIAQKIHAYFIKKYKICWVPDRKQNGLAGALSHPKKVDSIVKYIGPLSRFRKIENMEKKFDLLVSISGPEPQRSIWEKAILSELKNYEGTVLILRGLPNDAHEINLPNSRIKMVNHLPAAELNLALEQSEIVISRSGFTTIMDLVKLKKNAILVPTPGQTEQEYLAKFLMKKGFFYSTTQENFSLKKSLEHYHLFKTVETNIPTDVYKTVINEFVVSLKTGNFAAQ